MAARIGIALLIKVTPSACPKDEQQTMRRQPTAFPEYDDITGRTVFPRYTPDLDTSADAENRQHAVTQYWEFHNCTQTQATVQKLKP